MKMRLAAGYWFIAVSLWSAAWASRGQDNEKITLSINGRPLTVEIARTPSERRKGLMKRKSLDWNAGMLFVFRDDEIRSFWMKDTELYLSIAFLDKNGKVTDIFDMKPFSLIPVRSSKPCRYAIEANLNFFKEAGLSVGDRINLDMVK
ncbi:MAG: DUF192 domain-containing protein [Spirochaetota bacterium]|nr:MAG: DUF192 domain-containing protein [Spirochaetota bacterium]